MLISSLAGLPEVIEMASSLGMQAEAVLSERCFFEQLMSCEYELKKTGQKAQ